MPFTVLRVSKFDDQIEVTAEFEHQDEAEKFVEVPTETTLATTTNIQLRFGPLSLVDLEILVP